MRLISVAWKLSYKHTPPTFILIFLDWPTLPINNAVKARLEMLYKLHRRLVVIDSAYLPKATGNITSHRKNITWSHDIASWWSSTYTCRYFLALYLNGTACPGGSDGQDPGLFQVQAWRLPNNHYAHPSPFFYLFYPTSFSAYYPFKRSLNHIIFIANTIRYNHQYTNVGWKKMNKKKKMYRRRIERIDVKIIVWLNN